MNMILKTRSSLIALLFLATQSILYSQSQPDLDCSFLKDCKMILLEQEDESVVIIKDTQHVEYVNENKDFVKSNVKWINECEYKATITDFRYPGFPFKVGDVLHSTVTKIVGDTLYFDLIVNDFEVKAKYLRID